MTASDHRGEVDTQYDYECPAPGSLNTVWGTEIYTDDSSVCSAAVHAGLITLEDGGTVTIEMRPGEASYTSTAANGVTSAEWGCGPPVMFSWADRAFSAHLKRR